MMHFWFAVGGYNFSGTVESLPMTLVGDNVVILGTGMFHPAHPLHEFQGYNGVWARSLSLLPSSSSSSTTSSRMNVPTSCGAGDGPDDNEWYSLPSIPDGYRLLQYIGTCPF
jgi:hypothetical protein